MAIVLRGLYQPINSPTNMGQYYKGGKIGTCESMYYMRLTEAQDLAARGEKDDDGIKFSEYLKDNQTKWRFPFPNEDKMMRSDRINEPYDKSFLLPSGNVEVEHGNICIGNSHKGGGHNVNIFLPCPHSQKFKDVLLFTNGMVSTSVGGAGESMLGVRFQAIRDGKEKTVFECPRCGSMMRFDDADVETIKQAAREYYKVYDTTGKNPGYTGGNQGLYDYAMEVTERIK